jgi:hypothetical protein
MRGGSATTNQRTRGTLGKWQEAVLQQEAEDERNVVRGDSATRGRCNYQPENKRGTARGWCNVRQRRWAGGLEAPAQQEAAAGQDVMVQQETEAQTRERQLKKARVNKTLKFNILIPMWKSSSVLLG